MSQKKKRQWELDYRDKAEKLKNKKQLKRKGKIRKKKGSPSADKIISCCQNDFYRCHGRCTTKHIVSSSLCCRSSTAFLSSPIFPPIFRFIICKLLHVAPRFAFEVVELFAFQSDLGKVEQEIIANIKLDMNILNPKTFSFCPRDLNTFGEAERSARGANCRAHRVCSENFGSISIPRSRWAPGFLHRRIVSVEKFVSCKIFR